MQFPAINAIILFVSVWQLCVAAVGAYVFVCFYYMNRAADYPRTNTGGVNKMPNIKSAKKRVKVNETKAAANKARKSNLKTVIKKADIACTTGAADKAEAIKVAIKKVDQACAHGLMHKNKAARKKSQLAKKLNAAE